MAFRFQPITKKEIGTSLSEINVTPLVDVMLVLLIIFMVTAPMMHTGIDIDLPQAETVSSPADEGLTIKIDKDQFIHIDDQVVNQFLFEDTIKNLLSAKKNKTVFLQGDQSLPLGFIVEIMDILKKAGVQTIGIVTIPKKEE